MDIDQRAPLGCLYYWESHAPARVHFTQPVGDAALARRERRDTLTEELEALRDEINRALDPHERMRFVVAVGEPWTIENGFLTPTMKIRRSAIESFYAPSVEGWFAANQSVIWQE